MFYIYNLTIFKFCADVTVVENAAIVYTAWPFSDNIGDPISVVTNHLKEIFQIYIFIIDYQEV